MIGQFYPNPFNLFFLSSFECMDKFLNRNQKPKQPPSDASLSESSQLPTKQRRVDFNLEDLADDPGLRKWISEYNLNDQECFCRVYVQKGPCQLANHKFLQTFMVGKFWFN